MAGTPPIISLKPTVITVNPNEVGKPHLTRKNGSYYAEVYTPLGKKADAKAALEKFCKNGKYTTKGQPKTTGRFTRVEITSPNLRKMDDLFDVIEEGTSNSPQIDATQ